MIEIPTWREDQVLVQAGMSLGYAIGYDWFYDAYTNAQREVILRGASKHFLLYEYPLKSHRFLPPLFS